MKTSPHNVSGPPRVAVLTGYMPYFDELMGPEYPVDRLNWARANAGRLGGIGEIYFSGLIKGFEDGERVSRELDEFRPDVIVLCPTMASPAGFQWRAIEKHTSVPIVLWNVHGLQTIPPEYEATWIVPNSANVGCMMINNILRRHGLHPEVITGHVDDHAMLEKLQCTVRAAAVAGQTRRARFGVIGEPIEGYSNVVCDPDLLEKAIGARLQAIPVDEFTDAFKAVTELETEELAAQLRARYRVETRDQEEFAASVRLCITLRTIVERHGLSGGTYNCRHEYGVGNPDIGIIGCLANSYMTTEGCPFTCTGDIITAFAMYWAKKLGGDSYYCELDTVDYERDMVLCANTGEGDFCQSADCARNIIRSSGSESGWTVRGCSVAYPMPERTGTAVAFTPRAGSRGEHVIIAAEGEIRGTPDTRMQLPSMYFRFANLPVADGMTRWISSGATHHTAICSGRHGDALRIIANYLGIDTEIF